MRCKCHSGQEYDKCCGPFHRGEIPKTPTQLMRSRYCAFAMGNASYILNTTTQDNQDIEQIIAFCKHTRFEGLTILKEEPGEAEGYVTFRAQLVQDNRDASFTERSYFIHEQGRWWYVSGEVGC